MKKLRAARECLPAMFSCYRRLHFAGRHWLREHCGGPSSRREPMMRKPHEKLRCVLCEETHMQMYHSKFRWSGCTCAQENRILHEHWRIQQALDDQCFVSLGTKEWRRGWTKHESQVVSSRRHIHRRWLQQSWEHSVNDSKWTAEFDGRDSWTMSRDSRRVRPVAENKEVDSGALSTENVA